MIHQTKIGKKAKCVECAESFGADHHPQPEQGRRLQNGVSTPSVMEIECCDPDEKGKEGKRSQSESDHD